MNHDNNFIAALNEWVSVFMHRSMQNLHKFSKESGFSLSQLFALNFINHQGSCGVSDIGEGLGVSSAAASQLLDKLVQQGFIQRTEDPEDRRGKQITLTKQGEQVLGASHYARKSWFSELEDQLSHQEKQQAISAFNLLITKSKQIYLPGKPDYSLEKSDR